jgi:hypothetical protein
LKTKALFVYGTSFFDGNVAFHHACDSKCWSNWKGTDYSILGNNCNTFTSTVLSCVYGLSQKKPHLGVSDLVTVHGHCPAHRAADLQSKVKATSKSITKSMVPEHSTEVETGDSPNDCADSMIIEGDAECRGDAYKVLTDDPYEGECCAACAADPKCVQWGYTRDTSISSSQCYLSSIVTTAHAKQRYACGRKATSDIVDLQFQMAVTAKSITKSMGPEHSTEVKTGDSANDCFDSCKLEADTLCHGDAYKVIDTDPTLQECCDACAADSKCVQWGRFYGGVVMSSKCYLSSTVTTAQAKRGSTCGRKSTSGQDVVV